MNERKHGIYTLVLLSGLILVWGCAGGESAPDADSRESPSGQEATHESASHGDSSETAELEFLHDAPGHTALDPDTVGWTTERFHSEVSEQLHHLSDLLKKPGPYRADQFHEIVSEDFRAVTLRPDDLVTAYDEGGTTVRRMEGEARLAESAEGSATGPARLAELFSQLADGFGKASDLRNKLKNWKVELGETQAATMVDAQINGVVGDRALQRNANWKCHWTVPEHGELPLLTGIDLEEYDEIEIRDGAGTLFSDCTKSALGGDNEAGDRLHMGSGDWWGRAEAVQGVTYYGHEAVALGDVNGDDLEDLYVCQAGGRPNRLLLHQPDGTVKDATPGSGADWYDHSEDALLVDLDGDGDQDLLVSAVKGLIVQSNDGAGHFEESAFVPMPLPPGTLSVADYDQDGDVDVFVCRYSQSPTASDTTDYYPVPYHDAENGAMNVMLRNDGDWKFTDVTKETGLSEHGSRFSFAAAWEDYDNDGDQDLYVANDFGRNSLYRNDGGRFEDVAAQLGVEDISAGMGVAWADYDRDGWMDLYVSNMWSSAGHRITYQSRFQPEVDATTRGQLQRHARGNSLFRNVGGKRFEDMSLSAAVTMGRWAWSSMFSDLNNDGRQDIVVANGFLTNELAVDL